MDQNDQNPPQSLWRCSTCHFDNNPLLAYCEICDTYKPLSRGIHPLINQTNISHTNLQSTQKIVCLNKTCNSENDFNIIRCLKCKSYLIEGLGDFPDAQVQQKSDEQISKNNAVNLRKVQMIVCRCCQKENISTDQYCFYCSEVIQNDYPLKSQPDSSNLNDGNLVGSSPLHPLAAGSLIVYNSIPLNPSQNAQHILSTGLFSSNSSNNPPNFPSNPTGSKISSNSQNSLPSGFSSSSSSQKTQASSKSTSPKIYEGKETYNYCYDCKSYDREVKKGKGYIYVCKCKIDEDAIHLVEKFFCNFCFQNLEYGEYDDHAVTCKQRQQFYDRNSQAYERCTPLQIQTIMHINDESEIYHYAGQEKLLKRIRKLGYKLEDFVNLYHYIVNYAPIIIHIHAHKHFTFYLKDTHYRNQFETYKSSGCKDLSVRADWEDSMFDNMYQNAEPYERVKYGTMNISNDPHGVSVLADYGKSYFLLKEHVRNRCTMTDMYQTIVSTLRFCNHLLGTFTKKELQAAFDGACGQEVKSDGIISEYKEIQIHGPIEFKKDIQTVYVHRDEVDKNPNCLEEIKKFCKNNNVPYELFGKVEKPMQEKNSDDKSFKLSTGSSRFGNQQGQNGSSLSRNRSISGGGKNLGNSQSKSVKRSGKSNRVGSAHKKNKNKHK